MRALFFCVLAGCAGESDPCRGKPAACVSVTALGSWALDELDVTAMVLGGKRLTGQVASLEFVLPVKFALLLPADTQGLVDVGLVGSFHREPVASGGGETAISGGRGALTVRLGAFSGDLAVPPAPL